MKPAIHSLLRACVAGLALCAAGVAGTACAAGTPKIAVTDLSYEEKVSGYFEKVEVKGKRSRSASSSESDEHFSEREREREDISVRQTTEFETHISRGELRKFTADIKGELLKAGYKLVQGKPWTAEKTDTLYDIIARIKKGYYPGADYVLFGSINNIEFRQDINPVQGTRNTLSSSLSLELVGEFSLINTRTYEVKAAFTAMGEGSDTKLVSGAGARLGTVSNNRSRVMLDVSRSLGEAVAQEVQAQFGEGAQAANVRAGKSGATESTVVEEKVIRYK